MPGSHRVLESHAPVEGNHGNSLLTGVMCDDCHSLTVHFFASNIALTLQVRTSIRQEKKGMVASNLTWTI